MVAAGPRTWDGVTAPGHRARPANLGRGDGTRLWRPAMAQAPGDGTGTATAGTQNMPGDAENSL